MVLNFLEMLLRTNSVIGITINPEKETERVINFKSLITLFST